MILFGQLATARGCPAMSDSDISEEDQEHIWEYFNGLTPEVYGVSVNDLEAGFSAIESRFRELISVKPIDDQVEARNLALTGLTVES